MRLMSNALFSLVDGSLIKQVRCDDTDDKKHGSRRKVHPLLQKKSFTWLIEGFYLLKSSSE